MTTAPAEMRKATGIWPCTGGRSGLSAAAEPLLSTPTGTLADVAPAETSLATDIGMAAANPRVAEFRSKSLRLIMLCDLPTCGLGRRHPGALVQRTHTRQAPAQRFGDTVTHRDSELAGLFPLRNYSLIRGCDLGTEALRLAMSEGTNWEHRRLWRLPVNAKLLMVARGGIEPPTRGFSVRCSTN